MNIPRLFRCAGRLAALLAGCAAAVSDAAGTTTIYESYDALWKTLPNPAFSAADEKPLDDPQSFEGQSFRAWGAVPADGVKPAAGAHRVEILGRDMTVDHHRFPFAHAQVFPGEDGAEVGADARLFVGARDVCVQGAAPSSSGTAQRHVHVRLLVDAFTPRARRYDLPSLFGSCLALTRDAQGVLAFPEGAYHTAEGAAASDGVDFRTWQLRAGRFAKTDAWLRIRFPDPDNVYRFSVLAP
jgi:hypothetical protein